MDNLKRLLKTEKRHELILGALFVIYTVFQIQTPHSLALLVDNLYGTVIVIFLALTLFTSVNPIIAILGLVAATELLRRSSVASGSTEIMNQLPAENWRTSEMLTENQFPITLEEEVIKNMTPLVHENSVSGDASYKPVLEDDNNATLLSSI